MISDICLNNSENQQYIFQFINIFYGHIGSSDEISSIFINVFGDNENILYEINKKPILVLKKNENHDLASGEEKKEIKKYFLQELISSLKNFPPKTISEIIKILSKFCYFKDYSIYINQDKIFDNFILDRYNRGILIKIFTNIENNQFLIELPEKTLSFEEFINMSIFSEDIIFLKEQLNLFSCLCLNRNYNTCKFFNEVFPLNILVKYILSESIDKDFRAIFCRLMRTLYLDKEPFTIQIKPNLIRIMKKTRSKNNNNLGNKINKIMKNLTIFYENRDRIEDDSSNSIDDNDNKRKLKKNRQSVSHVQGID